MSAHNEIFVGLLHNNLNLGKLTQLFGRLKWFAQAACFHETELFRAIEATP